MLNCVAHSSTRAKPASPALNQPLDNIFLATQYAAKIKITPSHLQEHRFYRPLESGLSVASRLQSLETLVESLAHCHFGSGVSGSASAVNCGRTVRKSKALTCFVAFTHEMRHQKNKKFPRSRAAVSQCKHRALRSAAQRIDVDAAVDADSILEMLKGL